VFSGFQLADAPPRGLRVIAMTNTNEAGAQGDLPEYQRTGMGHCASHTTSSFEPLEQSIEHANGHAEFPVILVDHATIAFGGSQDTMT